MLKSGLGVGGRRGYDGRFPCDNLTVAKIPKRLPRDVNARAVAIARLAIEADSTELDGRPLDVISRAKDKSAKGGRSRAGSLNSFQKHSIAKKAAAARWKKST